MLATYCKQKTNGGGTPARKRGSQKYTRIVQKSVKNEHVS